MLCKQHIIFLVLFIETFFVEDVQLGRIDACRAAFKKLKSPENGRLQHRRSYSRVKYICDEGFVLIPRNTEMLRCRNGKYEGVRPSCEVQRQHCPQPVAPDHGFFIPKKADVSIGAKIIFECDDGYYIISGSRRRKCSTSGYWTGSQPVCKAITFCSKLEDIENGFVNITGNRTGSTATYSCISKEYELKGNPVRTCMKSGKWSGEPPLCKEKQCRQINRRLRNGHWYATDPSHKLYSTIEFSCNEGYELVRGPKTLVCTEYGWKPPAWPRCRVPVCSKIKLDYGRTCCGNTFKINSTIRFSCNSGFTLIGAKSLTCKEDKSWSGTPPVCDDGAFDCVNPGVPLNGIKIGSSYNQDEMVEFKCDKDFILVGSQNRTCINGTWTDTQPECIDKYDDRFFPSLNDTALVLKENVIDVLKRSTCSSENSTCDKRGRSIVVNDVRGLDIVFVLDKSSSIAKADFLDGLKFVNKMIDTFGVSDINDPTGTQIALVTYSHRATIEFNLGDDRASTPKGAKELVDQTQYSGGGTNTRAALDLVGDVVYPMARVNSFKVLFVIADGKSNIGKSPEKKADELREVYGFHIHVLAVGRKIDKAKLQLLADQPLKEHFFQLKNYDDLGKLMDAVKTEDKNIDYSICGQSPFDSRGRVVGGVKAEKGEWPWTVSLLKNSKHHCGASIIDSLWILTAAHCFQDEQIQKGKNNAEPSTYKGTNNFQIVAGEYSIESEGEISEQQKSIKKIYIHQEWNRKRFTNDIALIKLKDEEELQYNRFARPVCLPRDIPGHIREELVKPGHSTIAVGWGRTTQAKGIFVAPKDMSDVLLRTTLPIAESKKCEDRTKIHGDFYSSQTMLCAGDGTGSNDTCKGDSGGPMAAHYFDQQTETSSWIQVGIVSWGTKGCGLPNEYGVYTNLKHYVKWIDDVMNFDAEFFDKKRR